jgi:hypothetical protein
MFSCLEPISKLPTRHSVGGTKGRARTLGGVGGETARGQARHSEVPAARPAPCVISCAADGRHRLTLPAWLSAAGPRRRRRYVAHATALKIPRGPTAYQLAETDCMELELRNVMANYPLKGRKISRDSRILAFSAQPGSSVSDTVVKSPKLLLGRRNCQRLGSITVHMTSTHPLEPRRQSQMKAAFIKRYGGPDVLKYGDLPDPVAAPVEVVIDVVAASVNAADWKVRAGQYSQAKFPLILGRDFSGVIGAIGEGVSDLKVGDAVFGVCEAGQEAAYAEKIAVKAAIVAKKPDELYEIEENRGKTSAVNLKVKYLPRVSDDRYRDAVADHSPLLHS